jgi:hypothetical protein
VLVVAACGSATKKDVIARANAICATAQRDLRALTPPAGASMSELAAYFGHVVPIVETEAKQVGALPRPQQDLVVLNSWIHNVTIAAGEFRALLTAARLGDRAAVNTALAALRTNHDTELAARYGAGICAASAGTASGSGT